MVLGRGIVGTLELAVAVALAVPVAITGTSLFLGGQRSLGTAFLVLAVLMIAVEEYLATPAPTDLAGETVERVAGAVVEESDEE
jgi:hypothetical protein